MITVPENVLISIPETPEYNNASSLVVESFNGKIKRDWFVNHAYWCLPLTIGNQYGFGIKSLKKFTITWDGSDSPIGTKISILEEGQVPTMQSVSSHFGMGTVTIQNRFTFRTPTNINLMTINPPNFWIDGIQHMTGVIETDNLRRDFTFNLKVTRPDYKITINVGDYIGCVLPIPRYFVDKFRHKPAQEVLSNIEIQEEQQAMRDFGIERSTTDRNKPHGNGRRYFDGKDIYGNQFPDHQKKVR